MPLIDLVAFGVPDRFFNGSDHHRPEYVKATWNLYKIKEYDPNLFDIVVKQLGQGPTSVSSTYRSVCLKDDSSRQVYEAHLLNMGKLMSHEINQRGYSVDDYISMIVRRHYEREDKIKTENTSFMRQMYEDTCNSIVISLNKFLDK